MNKQPSLPGSARRLRGIALIEALIGILIFAFGVLGLMGLQAAMTKAQTSAKVRADAANLASDLFGLIQTDIPGNLSNYANKGGTKACASYVPCSDWLAKVGATLPAGTVSGAPAVARSTMVMGSRSSAAIAASTASYSA